MFLKKTPNWFTYKIKYDMYNQLSIWINKYLNKLHSIYTFIPQKRIGFSNSYFIEWACSCRPIITVVWIQDLKKYYKVLVQCMENSVGCFDFYVSMVIYTYIFLFIFFSTYEYLVQWHILPSHVNVPSVTRAINFSYVCIKIVISYSDLDTSLS